MNTMKPRGTRTNEPPPFDDPFAYLTAVIRQDIKVETYDLSALPNNILVVEILEAAKKSAEQNQTIFLNKK